jgi:hypothetical protein
VALALLVGVYLLQKYKAKRMRDPSEAVSHSLNSVGKEE